MPDGAEGVGELTRGGREGDPSVPVDVLALADPDWLYHHLDVTGPAEDLALFRLAFPDETHVDPRAAGRPVYLLLAMTPDKVVRMKPQNLIVGLPVTVGAQAA